MECLQRAVATKSRREQKQTAERGNAHCSEQTETDNGVQSEPSAATQCAVLQPSSVHHVWTIAQRGVLQWMQYEVQRDSQKHIAAKKVRSFLYLFCAANNANIVRAGRLWKD